MDQEEPIVDGRRIGQIVRRRWKAWTLLGVGLLGAGVGGGLYLLPQTFTSTVSISVQRPGGASSPLGGLIGLNGGQKSYGGVVKSLRMAEEVNAEVGLQNVYRLPSKDEASRRLSKSVALDDNAAEGLMYITVSLPAPPRYARHADGLRMGAQQASAQAANAYAEALRRYTVETDNDKEAVMLRMAENQIREARAGYDSAIDRLQAFVHQHRSGAGGAQAAQAAAAGDSGASSGTDKGSGAGGDKNSASAAAAGGELGGLYRERASLEQDIQTREATRTARTAMLDNQLQSLSTLPGEDPLLTGARAEERRADEELQSLKIQFEAEHPQVIAAQERLRIAQARVRKEVDGLKNGLTSDRAAYMAELTGLRSRLDKVQSQIALAEGQAQTGREQTAQLEKLRNEAQLRLEVLKATSTQVATLRVQTASSQSRILVIDRARVAEFSQPGLTLITLFSLFASLAALLFWLIVEYAFGKREPVLVVTPLARTPNDYAATAVINIHSNGAYGSGVHVNAVHGKDTHRETVNAASANGTNYAYANGTNGNGAHYEPIMIISDIDEDAEGTSE